MAKTEFEVKRDEMELDDLQRTISTVEAALAASTPGTRPIFETYLRNAKSRVGTLQTNIKEAEREREGRSRDDLVAVAYKAQKESGLSAREKETYSGFLEKEFFTKNDFGALEKFYEKSWDRLSEDGKDEMSYRFWEGIRQNQYSFGDAPGAMQEREAEQAYKRLRDSTARNPEIARIPESDREEFLRAYERGDRENAFHTLERETFANNLGTNLPGRGSRSDDAASEVSRGGQADMDLSTIDFSGIKSGADASSIAPTDVANNSTSPGRSR